MFFIRYPFPEIRDEVPENLSKPFNFLTAGGSARIGTGLRGGLKELLTFNKCERFLPVHNGSFAISDLTTHTLSLRRSELPVVGLSFAGCCCDRVRSQQLD
jgi:hypothetical protein